MGYSIDVRSRSPALALWVWYHYCIEAIGYVSKYPGYGAMMTKPISETSAAPLSYISSPLL